MGRIKELGMKTQQQEDHLDLPRRIVIDRGYEILYLAVTHKGIVIDALPIDTEDLLELGNWTWAEMESTR